jgi:hypothetical protein
MHGTRISYVHISDLSQSPALITVEVWFEYPA